MLTSWQALSVAILPMLFAITVHEVAHGWVAKQLGDPTAERLGRLTLNPMRHIDIVGTVLVPIFLFVTTGFVFGWARPVPVTWENLRRPKTDMALVAVAGPIANLLMALAWGLVGRVSLALPADMQWWSTPLYYMSAFGIVGNIGLMVLNLMPIPPLDGGRVLVGLLPGRLSWRYSQIEPYGFIIIAGLLFTHILDRLLGPVMGMVQHLVLVLTGGSVP